MEPARFAVNERIKASPDITVSALEDALKQGFDQIGHRNLSALTPQLEGMSWKTSPAKHLQAFVILCPILQALLGVCKNGLVPDAKLQSAMRACHDKEIFVCLSEGYQALSNYVLLRLRQMAAKIRDLISGSNAWEVLSRKCNNQQKDVFIRLIRCICPAFLKETGGGQAPTNIDHDQLHAHVPQASGHHEQAWFMKSSSVPPAVADNSSQACQLIPAPQCDHGHASLLEP